MRVIHGFITRIRWLLIIKAVTISHRFSPRLSDLIGERTGLNDALLLVIAESDKREAGSEPPSALHAKS
jgi:hypothetical protein